MVSALDVVTWRATLADVDKTPSGWATAANWAAGTGTSAQSAGTVTAGPVFTFNRTPTTNPTSYEYFSLTPTITGTVGKRYRVSATFRHSAGMSPVRLAMGTTGSPRSCLSDVTGEPETLSFEFNYVSGGMNFQLMTEPGQFDATVELLALSVIEVGRDASVDVEMGLRIRYGRPSWLDSTEPSSATFSMLASSSLTVPSIGENVTITATVPNWVSGTYEPSTRLLVRFSGTITGLTFTPGHYAVTATGPLTQLAFRATGGSGFASESEVNRFKNILSGAGLSGVVNGTARMTMKARAAGLTNAGQLMSQTALHTGAFVTETRTGRVVILTAQALDDAPTILNVDPELTLLEPYQATFDTGGVINRVVVSYGDKGSPTWDATSGTDRPQYVASNATSIATYGTRLGTYDTELNDLASATNLGNWLLDVLATPRWELPGMAVSASVAETFQDFYDVAQLTAGQGVYIPTSPSYGPVSSYRAVVMGWEESIDETDWSITYNLGAFRLAALGSVTWIEAPSTIKWNTTAVTWRTATTVASLT